MNNGVTSQNIEFERVESDPADMFKPNNSVNSPHSITRNRRSKNNILNKNNNYLNGNLIFNSADFSEPTLSPSTTDSIGLITSEDTIELQQLGAPNAISRSLHGQTRTSHAFWNLCKCYVGAASFALPWAVSQTGLISAIIGFLLLASLAWLTFRWMLISSHYANKNTNPTYPELAEIAFNKFFPLFKHNTNSINYIEMAETAENTRDESESEELIDNNMDKIVYENTENNRYKLRNYRCGKIGKILVYLCMFFGMIGACGSYILFISSVIQSWLAPLLSAEMAESAFSFYISICILLPFPIILSLTRSYSFLSSTAKFGVAGVALALLVTLYDGILRISDGAVTKQTLSNNLLYVDLSGFPIFVGNACFLFIIHAMILSQEQSMIDRETNTVSTQFKKANNLSLLLVTLINMVFAVFAYISFIDMSPFPDNIVDGLDAGVIQQITRACLCIDLLFTYALIMYPFTEALDTELFDVTQLNNRSVIWKGNIIRIVIVVITAGIAIGIPHFGYLTGLTGGSASVFLGFILPPIFIWRLAPQKINKFELYFMCPVVFLFGCVMFIWSPYLILKQMYS